MLGKSRWHSSFSKNHNFEVEASKAPSLSPLHRPRRVCVLEGVGPVEHVLGRLIHIPGGPAAEPVVPGGRSHALALAAATTRLPAPGSSRDGKVPSEGNRNTDPRPKVPLQKLDEKLPLKMSSSEAWG